MRLPFPPLLPLMTLLAGGMTLLGQSPLQAGDPPSAGAPPAVAAPQQNARIPEGKGATAPSGKFIPAGTGETTPRNHEALEQQLRSALKVEEEAPGKFRIGLVTFDATARTVSLPAKVKMRGGVIEYALTTEAGKAHEALLTTTANPRDLHIACLLLGMKAVPPGPQKGGGDALPESEGIRISVLWETNGPAINRPLCALMQLAAGGPDGPVSPMKDVPWHYTGSGFTASGGFAADLEGSIISLIRDGAALVNNPGPSRDHDDIHVPNSNKLPPAGTPVIIRFQLPAKP